jgi:hypothetical protein
LLDKFAQHLGFDQVEGKQKIIGLISNREIEVDGKAVRTGQEGIFVVEFKDHNRKVVPSDLEALAFRIQDVGASGGIIVTPIGLQDGAKCIAEATNIMTATLSTDPTPTEFALRFVKHVMVGLEDRLDGLRDEATCVVHRVNKPNEVPESRNI